jgi:hypothetical protein
MPADIMNLIASFLTFDDVETEEEFITREKTTSLQSDHVLDSEIAQDEKIKKPIAWLKKHKTYMDKNIEDADIYFIVYSPDNKICAVTYGDCCFNGTYYLSIIDIKTKKELHNVCLRDNDPDKYYQHVAVSSCGNIFATCYTNNKTSLCHKPYTKIKNLHTKTKEYPHHYLTAWSNDDKIAFNKQGTHLIMHSEKYDKVSNTLKPHHVIIPLTTTLEKRELPQKTLTRYFAQKGICKNLIASAEK